MKSKVENLLHRGKNRLLATNKILLIAWSFSLLAIVGITLGFKAYRVSFVGFAESRETLVNYSYPVQVDKVHVITGQRVQQGELLAELSRPDLNMQLHDVQAQIDQLEAQSDINKEIAGLNLGPSPELYKSDADFTEPVDVQLQHLRKQLRFLEDQKKELLVFSKSNGVVGEVHYKQGEVADPFTPIVSVSPSAPSYVQGYINEKLYTEVQVGQQVVVTSQAKGGKQITGRIASVGSRIVEFPLRLQGRLAGQLWGREVVVEIPRQNPFLLGEKVQINQPSHVVDLAHATLSDSSEDELGANPVQALSVPREISERMHIEPSGLVYNEKLNHFMLISDDTDKKDRPYVFLMGADGSVKDPPLRVNGLDAVEDLEAIFTDDSGLIYILASQDKKADKKDHQARATLASLRFEAPLDLSLEDKVYLRPLLLKAVKDSPISELKALYKDLKDDLDVEGAFTHKGDLFIALKEPLSRDDEGIILRVTNLKQLIRSKHLTPERVQIWAKIKLPTMNDSQLRISDAQMTKGHLLLATTCKGGADCGALWKVSASDSGVQDKPQLIEKFSGMQPEGLFWEPKSEHLYVTFDQGGKSVGRWTKIPMRQW